MTDTAAQTESKAPPVPSPDWQGTVQLVSADQDVLDISSRAAEAALAIKRYLVDKDEEDEGTCQFPVEKASRPAGSTCLPPDAPATRLWRMLVHRHRRLGTLLQQLLPNLYFCF